MVSGGECGGGEGGLSVGLGDGGGGASEGDWKEGGGCSGSGSCGEGVSSASLTILPPSNQPSWPSPVTCSWVTISTASASPHSTQLRKSKVKTPLPISNSKKTCAL
eukprot:scaffold44_cov411-Prasinococcus_capsulatus_cf.AAC.50